ncbi:uncharacterized protein LOC144994591 [Oryzias latipes]
MAAMPVKREAKNEALEKVIELALKEMQTALDHLNAPSLLPNISCGSLNVTEMLEPEHKPFIVQISSIRCNMEAFSKLMPELTTLLRMSSQYLQDIEISFNNQTVLKECTLPVFEERIDIYLHAKCLLQLVTEKLSTLRV